MEGNFYDFDGLLLDSQYLIHQNFIDFYIDTNPHNP